MADYDSSLPVRTEADGTDERLHVKIVDGATPAQRAEVDTDKNLHIEVHGNNPAGSDETLRMSELGHAAIDGAYDGTNNTDPSNIGMIAHDRKTTPADADQIKRVTAKTGTTDTTVHALDVSLHDEDGNKFSRQNPLPVTSVDSEGTEVQDYDRSDSIAAESSDDHDYSVADGDTFILRKILAAASGKMRVELKIGDGANPEVFATKAVVFNSTSNPNAEIDLDGCPITVVGTANTTTVRVTKKNEDKQAQDMYSTILGITN